MIKHSLKFLFVFIFLPTSYFLLPTHADADDVAISAAVDRNVIGLDEQALLQVNVSGAVSNVPEPKFPALANFTVYPAGQSSNFSFVNGKAASSLTFSYSLTPKTAGKFTIPPISVDYNGKTYQTAEIAIEVTQGKPPAAQAGPSTVPGAQEPAPAQQGAGSKEMFVEGNTDKDTVYVNQQLTYYFRFYDRLQLLENPQFVPPNFSGFWTEAVPPKNYKTSVNGKQYGATEVGTILFPTKPGKISIGPASLRCRIAVNPNQPFSDDFFQSFFGGAKVVDLQTKPIPINVIPLPEEGKPAGFNGIVGEYSVTSQLDTNTVKTNEAVTLAVTITGTGNIKTITEPHLSELPDFRRYETVSSVNVSGNTGIMKGSKVFKTVLVPVTPGRKTIPPVSFSFFDPVQKKYKTLTTSTLTLTVKQGPALPSNSPGFAAPGGTPHGSMVTILNTDIRYIKALNNWHVPWGPLYSSGWFIFFNSLPLIGLGFVFGFKKWEDTLSADTAFARRLKASPAAKKYLKQAKNLLSQPRAKEFYSAISRAVAEYIAHKFNVSPEGLVSGALSEMLASRNVPEALNLSVRDVLDECDMARFAPTQMTEAMMKETYAKAVELIGKLEKYL